MEGKFMLEWTLGKVVDIIIDHNKNIKLKGMY